VIRTFRCSETERLFHNQRPKGLPSTRLRAAKRKLDMLHAATSLDQLRALPGNRLEALRGDRAGQWSIRTNDQWRICFRWDPPHAFEVEIVDYP
jgi:proteic killer suppression protein